MQFCPFDILAECGALSQAVEHPDEPAMQGCEWGEEHSPPHPLEGVMHKLSPVMLRTLRQVQLYGYLSARSDRLYHPGSNHPVCSLHTAQEMIRSGWLVLRDGRYEITTEGLRAAKSGELSH